MENIFEIVMSPYDGKDYVLTTEDSPGGSRHVLEDSEGNAYAPGDPLTIKDLSSGGTRMVTAGDIVSRWALVGKLSTDSLVAAKLFLAQSPDYAGVLEDIEPVDDARGELLYWLDQVAQMAGTTWDTDNPAVQFILELVSSWGVDPLCPLSSVNWDNFDLRQIGHPTCNMWAFPDSKGNVHMILDGDYAIFSSNSVTYVLDQLVEFSDVMEEELDDDKLEDDED